MLPILHIGPLALPMPELSILLSLWFGITLSEHFSPKRGISADTIYNLIFSGLISGLVAARLGYIFQYLDVFAKSPLSVFSINPGLLDLWSGLGGACIGMLVVGQRARVSFWNTLDALTPLFACLAIGLAASHIASGKAFGAPTNLAWGIELWGAKRHPSQFYELGGAVVILLLSGWFAKSQVNSGSLLLIFIGLQAAASLFLEAFRGDSEVLWGGVRAAQLTSWIVLLIVFLFLERLKFRPDQPAQEVQNG